MPLEGRMSELLHFMSNNELQDAIVQTNAMVKSCASDAQRMPLLQKHLESLLETQKSRASMAKLIEA
jgi:hypothetical protein